MNAAFVGPAPDLSKVSIVGRPVEGEGGRWVPLVLDLETGSFGAALAPVAGGIVVAIQEPTWPTAEEALDYANWCAALAAG